ncbi:Pyrimidine-nucleoside phosphorylase [Chlamydia trachomatis]|nr:Pyrimidine-nucleoside phosphorylase [Chlamydia trachomatis]CRH55605.1 Pyrimidine-nucleoside phosphorylase [Chlamydia trachomatis]
MRIIDIINKKANKQELTKQEIDFFIKNYVDGNIPDYQASALLMAIRLNSLNETETSHLTNAMIYSGDTID